jgi:hypothetical protein
MPAGHQNVWICRERYVRGLCDDRGPAQCLVTMNFAELASVPSDRLVPFTDRLVKAESEVMILRGVAGLARWPNASLRLR